MSFPVKFTFLSEFQVNCSWDIRFFSKATMNPATRYSAQEGIKIVEAYFTTKLLIQTYRQFWRDFPGRNAPTRVTILRLLNKFRETGSIQDKNKGHSRRLRSGRADNIIDNVREHLAILQGNPQDFCRRRLICPGHLLWG